MLENEKSINIEFKKQTNKRKTSFRSAATTPLRSKLIVLEISPPPPEKNYESACIKRVCQEFMRSHVQEFSDIYIFSFLNFKGF